MAAWMRLSARARVSLERGFDAFPQKFEGRRAKAEDGVRPGLFGRPRHMLALIREVVDDLRGGHLPTLGYPLAAGGDQSAAVCVFTRA
jgi:hypothetical protein